jgi:tetratricopeptide (TPR) repeat protein
MGASKRVHHRGHGERRGLRALWGENPFGRAGGALGFARWPYATILAVLLLFAVLPYANTLLNGFVYDDNNEVLNNPYVRDFGHLKEIFSTHILAHLGARGVTNYYRPISTLGFLLCYQAFGPLPYGFHLANVLLNAAVVCLLFGVSERMFGDRVLAFAAATLFALHPVHSESVAWVSAVTDLELAAFSLLTFWFFLGVARPRGGRSDWNQLGMIGSFVLALLSKEAAVTLPLLATIYEHACRADRGETTWRQKLARYFNLWLLAFAYFLFRRRFFGGLTAVLLMPHVTRADAFLSAFALAGQYLGKVLWPAHLRAFYTFHKSVSLLDLRVMEGLVALALCAALFVVLWRRARAASFGLIWFGVTLAPVLNSRWIGPNVFTERYLYLPSVGICWLGAWAIVQLWARVFRRSPGLRWAFFATLGLLAVLSMGRIVTRNRDWRDEVTYYRRALDAEPEAVGLRINLGAVYWNGGNLVAAEREWLEALKFAPENAMVLNNLGLVLAQRRQYEEAVSYFQRSMRLRPNYTDAHLNLGRVYDEMGMYSPAELQLRAAVALAPLSTQARNRLGEFYLDRGRLAEAEDEFRRSVTTQDNVPAYNSLGDIYARWHRADQAEQAYRAVVSRDDYDSHAHFGLAALYEAVGRTEEAAREYQAGLRTDPANPAALLALKKLQSHGSRPPR